MIKDQRAFVSGALFLLIAIFYLWAAWPLEVGKGARMGAGYFPRMMGSLLGLLGLLIMANAVRANAPREKLEPWNIKGLLLITGAIVIFAALLESAGLVLSLTLMLMLAMRASPDFSWRSMFGCIVVLLAIAVGAFHYGLKLQFSLWPTL